MRRKKRKRTALQVESTRELANLPRVQRMAVDALLSSTTKNQALKKLQDAGIQIERGTFARWMKLPWFVRAWKAREEEVTERITKSTVMVNAQNILEEAMTEQPIIAKKSGDIIGYKVELGHALTANEQLGKAIGAFGQNVDGKTMIVIDIDFSGRKNPVQEIAVRDGEIIEGEFTEAAAPEPPVISQSRPTGSGLAVSKPVIEEPDWLR